MKGKEKSTEYIFVYGSLRRDADSRVFSKVRDHLNYVGLGYFSGKLFDLGSYPGAIESEEDDVVKGEIYSVEEHRNEVFRILDHYEGFDRDSVKNSLFVRKRTTIRLKNGQRISGWVYLFNRPERIRKAKEISSGDYIRYKKRRTDA